MLVPQRAGKARRAFRERRASKREGRAVLKTVFNSFIFYFIILTL
jgi:hypothetical protein